MPSRVHGEAAWNGVAILSRAGLEDVVAGFPAPPASRTRRRAPWRRPAAASASSRCTCPTAASRTPSTTATSSPGWPSLRETVAAGPQADDRLRRHEHRADRRRRLRSPGLRRPHPRHAARARGAGGAAGSSACTTSSATAGRPSACSPTGTTAPECSTRTSACGSIWCSRPPRRRARQGGVGGPAGPQGTRAERSRAGDRRPRRGARRRHRTGRAAAVRAGQRAGQAAAGDAARQSPLTVIAPDGRGRAKAARASARRASSG